MDPLSITTSTLTIISALEASLRLIKTYCDAPSQLEALNNVIADFTAAVTEVARIIKVSQNKIGSLDDRTSHLTLALSNIRRKARDLDVLFRACVTSPSSTSAGSKVFRLSWLKVRSKVQSLQSELRDGRLNLLIALASFTASSSLRVELDVREVFKVTNETNINHQRLENRLTEERDQNRQAQDQFSAQVLAQLENLQLHRRKTEHGLTNIQGKTEGVVESLLKILQTDEHVNTVARVRKSPDIRVSSSPTSSSGSNQVGPWSSVGVRANLRNISECSGSCKCSCHIRRRLKTPRLLDAFSGTLFIGYYGSPLLSQNCDQRSCYGREDSLTNFTYEFPRWFVTSRIVQLKAKITAMYGPEVSLRFNRVVDGKALVFYYATIGDVSRMKQLFEQGRASPSDIRFDSGWTPLHYAMQNNQIDICKLLLQAGGDPYMETEAPTTAVDYAGAKILGNSVDVYAISNLRDLFFDTQFLEHGNFSELHKIIMRIRPGNIQEELQRSTADIDTVDSTGRSPLSWAAQRGETEAVRVLLEHGADPNNNDVTKMTPLHYAAQAKTPKCLLLLIRYGAIITRQTRGWTALHYVSYFHGEIAYIKPLLDHGADVDERTYVGKTALSFAVLRNHLKGAAFLIGLGADLDVLDNDGQSPLALSIKFRRFEAMKLLLDSGATHKTLSEGDDTLLHLVARFPDLEIIEYLSEKFWDDIDLDARNRDQLTARELLQLHNSDPYIALAFQKLLLRVAGKMDTTVEGILKSDAQEVWDSDSTTEIFEDAVE